MLDYIVKTVKNYYPQVFLEEWKYVIKEKKINKYIIDGVEISSDSHEETLLEKIQIEKKTDYKKTLMWKVCKNSDGKKFWWKKF